MRWPVVMLPVLALVSGGVVFAAMPLAPVWEWDQASGAGPSPAAALPATDRGVDRGATQRTVEAAVKTQMRREAEELQRQDVAAELARLGLTVKWQDHTLGDLLDWRARIQTAQALRLHYGVEVDWRASSLSELTDMRLRAAKASELSSGYGVSVDWQRYSWAALESLRRTLARLPALETGSSASALDLAEDALAQPFFRGRGRARRSPGAKDPDRLMAPTFAFDTPLVWSRRPGQATRWDHDALLVPTFVAVPPPTRGPDDIIDPWRRPFDRTPLGTGGNSSRRHR